MTELINNIKMWRSELERQGAGQGTMSVFDSICTYLGEQQRKIEQLEQKAKWLEFANKELNDGIPKHVKDYQKENKAYKSESKLNTQVWF